jgi:hypothetical protein
MGVGHYILIGKLAVPEPDLMKWGIWLETHDRHVARTMIGKIEVSTVFLGLDHNFGAGLPVLFETMVFRHEKGPKDFADSHCVRCESWDEAEKQHDEVVELVRREIREKVND